MITSILSFLTGFLTAIFAEPIRKKLYKAILKVEFKNNEDHLALTPERIETRPQFSGVSIPVSITLQAIYVRVNVQNITSNTAKNCRAYLVDIKKEKNGVFVPTIYCDSIPLSWSCQNVGEQYDGVEINKGVKQFLDVVTIRKDNKDFDPQIKVKPFRYIEIFKEKGKFCFTIQVTSSDSDPAIFNLVFEWNGDWKNYKVYSI